MRTAYFDQAEYLLRIGNVSTSGMQEQAVAAVGGSQGRTIMDAGYGLRIASIQTVEADPAAPLHVSPDSYWSDSWRETVRLELIVEDSMHFPL